MTLVSISRVVSIFDWTRDWIDFNSILKLRSIRMTDFKCPIGLISCGDGLNCYLPTWRCDGRVECLLTGADEVGCNTGSTNGLNGSPVSALPSSSSLLTDNSLMLMIILAFIVFVLSLVSIICLIRCYCRSKNPAMSEEIDDAAERGVINVLVRGVRERSVYGVLDETMTSISAMHHAANGTAPPPPPPRQ